MCKYALMFSFLWLYPADLHDVIAYLVLVLALNFLQLIEATATLSNLV